MKRLLAVALVAATLPVVPTSAKAPVVSPAARAARAEWAKQYRAQARNLPVTALLDAVDAAAAADAYHYAVLLPAGDLDGDGAGDVADLRIFETYDDETGDFAAAVTVDARRGRDGKLLWSKQLPGQFPYVLFTPVGAAGKPGMVTLAFDGDEHDALVAGAGLGVTDITAYEGATGKQLWTTALDAAYGATIVGGVGTETFVDDMADLVPGRATDLLLDTVIGAGAGDPLGVAESYRSTMQLHVLDGATGTVRDIGPQYATGGAYTYPAAIRDVTGDRADDAAVVVDEAGQRTLHALSSADGSEVYAIGNLAAGDEYGVAAFDDVTGDGVGDYAAQIRAYEDGTISTTLVDGKRGTALWTRNAADVTSVGDIDRKRGSELLLTDVHYQGDRIGFTVTAVTAANRKLWSTTRTVSTAAGDKGTSSRMSFGVIGDVHGDGVRDFGYSIVVAPFGEVGRRDEGIVNGRSGRVARDPAQNMYVASVAFDGRGVDSYTRTLTNGVLTVATWRGDAPRRLWQTVVPLGSSGDTLNGSLGLPLDRDRCGDLVVSVSGKSRTTSVALSGATGKPMWLLTRSAGAPGVVTAPRPRSVQRFARTC